MEHTVTNSIDLIHAVDNLAFAGGQHIDQSQKASLWVGRADSFLPSHHLLSVLDAAVHANALAQALSQNALVSHINELILQLRSFLR